MMQTDILIIGAGLSGLHTAHALEQRSFDYLLVEARQRLGGRILSRKAACLTKDEDLPAFDLGPAWFWPGQPRMQSLIHQLGLDNAVLDQFAEGKATYEDPAGQLQIGDLGISMAGSYRLHGGIGQLIEALSASVPQARLRLGWRAEAIRVSGEDLLTTMCCGEREHLVRSREVVVAMPPRLAEQTLRLDPEASPAFRRALSETPTWMAGQGKFVAVYRRPFWRQQGLSGDVFSHRGPLGEIHDISDRDDGPGALFGFFALPPALRREMGDALEPACLTQLTRIFGEQASEPDQVFSKDWAFDALTATCADRERVAEHSSTSLTLPRDEPWRDRVLWSGSETANAGPRNNGYLEGALQASARCIDRILERS